MLTHERGRYTITTDYQPASDGYEVVVIDTEAEETAHAELYTDSLQALQAHGRILDRFDSGDNPATFLDLA